LREISERRVARAHNAAPERRVDAGKQPQERRLSRPIRADESDPLAILQNATQPCKDFAGAIMAIEIGKTDEFHGPVTFTLSVWCFLRDRPPSGDAKREIDGVVANQCLMSTMGFADALLRAGVRWLAASPET